MSKTALILLKNKALGIWNLLMRKSVFLKMLHYTRLSQVQSHINNMKYHQTIILRNIYTMNWLHIYLCICSIFCCNWYKKPFEVTTIAVTYICLFSEVYNMFSVYLSVVYWIIIVQENLLKWQTCTRHFWWGLDEV